MDPEKIAETAETVGKLAPVVAEAARAEKSVWKSKTHYAALVAALLPLVYPPASVFIATNPEVYSALIGGVFWVLRVVTKDKVVIK